MPTTQTERRIVSSGQRRFFATLVVASVLFALGFSVTLFGLTTDYLVSFSDRIGVVAVGCVMLLVGAYGAYRTLS